VGPGACVRAPDGPQPRIKGRTGPQVMEHGLAVSVLFSSFQQIHDDKHATAYYLARQLKHERDHFSRRVGVSKPSCRI
jgi:hypothetical protein